MRVGNFGGFLFGGCNIDRQTTKFSSYTVFHSVLIIIIYLTIDFRVFWLLSIHCPNLEVLTYSSDEFPPSCEALWCLAQGCQGINCLQFPPLLSSPNAGIFNDSCLLQLARSWPKLLSLTVGGQEISVSGLAEVGMGALIKLKQNITNQN